MGHGTMLSRKLNYKVYSEQFEEIVSIDFGTIKLITHARELEAQKKIADYITSLDGEVEMKGMLEFLLKNNLVEGVNLGGYDKELTFWQNIKLFYCILRLDQMIKACSEK